VRVQSGGFYTARMNTPMTEPQILGFIGTGVMGEPMCRNLAAKSGRRVLAWDPASAPLERLRAQGVQVAGSAAEVAAQAGVLFLCLPGGAQLNALCEATLLPAARKGLTVVDLGTSGVSLARALAPRLAARGADYADAPIARTRAAADSGTLSITVGASPEVFARIEPLLRCMGSDITHCGAVGNGQAVKILNNMVLFQTVNALAEALALGRRAGVDPVLLFEAFAKGSADSFALRNHGMKAMVPGQFPERAFSVAYAAKDNGYALDLGRETGVRPRGAELLAQVLEETKGAGYGDAYWPVIAKVIDRA
jgi:3-hydroxyisobutyrate dehydrogenase